MTTLIMGLADGAIVLGIGLIVVMFLRRSSASFRHAVLASAIACALLMPVFERLLPQVPVIEWRGAESWSSGATLSSAASTSSFTAEDSSVRRRGELSWLQWFIAVWLTGALVMAGGLVAGFIRLRRLKARCTPVTGRWRELTDQLSRHCGVNGQVKLLQSSTPSLLITCGFFQPVIILPSGASSWPDDRCRAVLRHELAHIRRHDATVQIIGELLRILQWMNPLVWLACRRLRQESEYACDDAVLESGVEATEYATHLLGVARQLSGRHAAWLSAPAIAHPSTLERRIVAMLQAHRNRAPLGRRGFAFAALAAFGIGVPLAAAGFAPVAETTVISSPAPDVTLAAPDPAAPAPEARPARAAFAPTPTRRAAPERQATGSIAGTIVDQTGGTMPGVQVTLTNTAGGAPITTQTDASGQFAARDLPAGDYELVARLPGFATVTNRVKLAAGGNIRGSMTMPLGTLTETIEVACGEPSVMGRMRYLNNAIFPMVAAQEAPIRVGGNVRPPRKLSDTRPACPSAPAAETIVRLTARIDVKGAVFDIVPVPPPTGGAPPQEFVDSAIAAVREWKFTPTLLNGQAMEIGTTVQITFRPR